MVFDCDGVLTTSRSSWGHIHETLGVDNTPSLRAYLRGEIDEEEFLRRDVDLWRSVRPAVSLSDLRAILDLIPLQPGARETVAAIHEHGIRTACVSGGIDLLVDRVGRELGIDQVYANSLLADERGVLTGEGIVRVRAHHKTPVMKAILAEAGVSGPETVAVGDTGSDASLFLPGVRGIAFNSDDSRLHERAAAVVPGPDLRDILPMILDGRHPS